MPGGLGGSDLVDSESIGFLFCGSRKVCFGGGGGVVLRPCKLLLLRGGSERLLLFKI